MKRGIFISILLVVLGIGAGVAAFYLAQHRASSSTIWLQREFSLDSQQMARVEAIQHEYDQTCLEMCARIAHSDLRLKELMTSSRELTPQIQQALAETDAVRTACRMEMLKHFYQIANEMPPEKRQLYLDTVLPVVLHPGEMQRSHTH